MQTTQIVVTERAVLARVRRLLARDGNSLHKNRRAPYEDSLPNWYISNNSNHICDGFDNLEEFARDRGAMKPYEKLESD